MLRKRNLSAVSPTFLFLAACSNDVLTLGKGTAFPYGFDPPRLVGELITPGTENNNPTLTGDLLDIYFTTGGDNGQDVWLAQRSSRTETFRAPTLVAAASSPDRETSSAISPDGLSLWFASERPGGLGDLDIWRTTRSDRAGPWSEPTNLASLNSAFRDLPRPPGLHGLTMPMASDRVDPPAYRTMLASRPTTAADFGAPMPIPEFAGLSDIVDGCLTEDGLFLFLSTGTPGDLVVVQRSAATEPFGAPIPLTALNTAAYEADPWLSPDRTQFFFTSDRADGTRQIYVSTVYLLAP